MSTYLIIEFPNLETGLDRYLKAKELFSSRSSCLGRSETSSIVSFMIFKDDVNEALYFDYRASLPITCKYIEIILP